MLNKRSCPLKNLSNKSIILQKNSLWLLHLLFQPLLKNPPFFYHKKSHCYKVKFDFIANFFSKLKVVLSFYKFFVTLLTFDILLASIKELLNFFCKVS